MDPEKGMRILHVIDSGGLYGAENMLLTLVAEQVQQGMEPIIASIGDPSCGEKPLETEARHRGLHTETFRMLPGPNIAGALRILRFARLAGIEILHSHGYKGNILFGLMPKSLRRIPMVSTLHGWTRTGGWNKMQLYEYLERLSLHFIDQVVVVNRAMREKVRLKSLHVVNNGIPLMENTIGPKTPLNPQIVDFCRGGHTIGAVGRLSPEKGFVVLLDAMHEVAKTNPEARLVILGEGHERSALEAKIKNLGIEERVLMPGYVANARHYLPLFRVFALSSLTEGLPIVILEAMQAGVPIVATRVGGIPEVLKEGEAGKLVPANHAQGLMEGIQELLNDDSLVATITDSARNLLETKYSATSMALNYSRIYDGLVRRRCNNLIVGKTGSDYESIDCR